MIHSISVKYDVSKIQLAMAQQFMNVRTLANKSKVAESTVHRIFRNGAGHSETIGKLVRALKLNPKEIVMSVDTPRETVDVPSPLTPKAEQELVISAKENR